MNKPNDTDRTREQGVEFGSLTEKLARHDYPAECAELFEAYGDEELHLPNGTQRFHDVLEPLQNEQFDSSEEVQQAIIGLVDKKAIGREGYSDRTPPALGEDREEDPESF